jgi:outer membrane protein
MRSKILSVCFLFLSASAWSQAQETTDTTTVLTFVEAVKIALKNSVMLNTQKNQLELNEMQKNSSIAQIGPSVSLNADYRQFNGNSFNQQQGRAINGVRDVMSGSLNANMNLFNGFFRINAIKANLNQVDAQSYFVNRTAQDVINTVGTQYLQVLLDVELLRIAKENLEAQTRQLQQTQEFVRLGSRSQVEEYNMDALTKAAELRYVQAEITLNNDKALLAQTLLIDPFDQFNVRKPDWDINTISSDHVDPVEMLKTAMLHRGDYQQSLKNESAAKFVLRAYRGNMMPSLSAFFNYGSAYNFQHSVPDSILQQNPSLNRPFENQFREDNVYKSYGLQLTIPLFNGLQNKTLVKQQRMQYDNSVLNRNSMEFQLRNDVKRTASNFVGISKAYQVSLDQLRAAELAFQFETERYNLGVTNLVDYSTANRAYIQALTDKAQAEYRLLFQKIQMEYTLGTLKIEDLE